MSEDALTNLRRAGHHGQFLLFLLMGALAQGCAKKIPPHMPAARQYAIDQTGGAKACTVPMVTPSPGKDTPVAMSVGNDGGWCAISVSQPGTDSFGPTPFKSGLLTARPTHGKVYIHTVGDDTRIDYTPAPGFAGNDNFAVTLLPGAAVLRVDATVTK